VCQTLKHRTPDRVAMDFGSTAVTGMHVTCVAQLRDYYGLEKRPVKVCELYQMLGEIEDDLMDANKPNLTLGGRNSMRNRVA